MKTLIKYLSKSWKTILLIISLLVVQAICDLSLPGYTSNIINIGIQQGGIDSALPTIMRENTYNEIILFMTNENKEILNNSYKLLDKNTLSIDEYEKYLKKYPLLEQENLYLLKDNINKNELENIVSKPILLSTMLTTDNEEGKLFQNKFKENVQDELKNMTVLEILKVLDEEAKNKMLEEIDNIFSVYPDSIV